MTVLAHGGTPGLIAEIAIGLTVAALLAAVWLREKRRRARGERHERAPMHGGEE
jgi:hypothetical protein